jgi:hypothetical protein
MCDYRLTNYGRMMTHLTIGLIFAITGALSIAMVTELSYGWNWYVVMIDVMGGIVALYGTYNLLRALCIWRSSPLDVDDLYDNLSPVNSTDSSPKNVFGNVDL